jgi:hypothetical protein
MIAFDILSAEPRWVAWRNERRWKDGKPTKVPYCAGGRKAKADDPSTWGIRSAAEKCAQRIVNGLGGGVGIELGDLGGDTHLAGLDLDSCLVDGALAPWAATILGAAPTYAEISPSGNGIKVFFYVAAEDVRPFLDQIGAEPGQWGVRRDVPGQDARDHGPAIEIYFARRFFAVTENHLPDAPPTIEMLDHEALARLAPLMPPPRGTRTRTESGATATGDNSRSAIAFRKGVALSRGGATFEQFCEAIRTDPETAAWHGEKGIAAGGRELLRIWDKAARIEAGVSLSDFFAYMPTHEYLFAPTRTFWPASSVNARLSPVKLIGPDGKPKLAKKDKEMEIPASLWLDQNRPVEQMTWVPGMPTIIRDRLMVEGGWIERLETNCFNLYLPPSIELGDPSLAKRWIEHVRYLYPDEADHILDWLAHRVQRPHEKINHALAFLGNQGIGKDTILQPVAAAIGPWNFHEATPGQLLGRFNGFVKAVILRINEAHDLGEFNRFALYEHLKLYTAAPPDTLRVDEKHIREYRIQNCCGVIVTSNHETGALYLPADDRRHFVALSRRTKEDPRFGGSYWTDLHQWYSDDGTRHVAAYLAQRDLSRFDPKAPPPKTEAFWAIVNSDRPSEEAELADLIDAMLNPDALSLDRLIERASGDLETWLRDRKNRRGIPHRLEGCGYVPVRNPSAEDGLWKILGKRQVIYARKSLPFRDQIAAAERLR